MSDMKLVIKYDPATQNYAAFDPSETLRSEPLGIGKSPDEAVGMAVRQELLQTDGCVTIEDISHEKPDILAILEEASTGKEKPEARHAVDSEMLRQLRKINEALPEVYGIVPNVWYRDGRKLLVWEVIECTMASAEVVSTAEDASSAVATAYAKLMSSDDDVAAGFVSSKYVATTNVIDPDTGHVVQVEIRKLATGPMVGLDGCFLEQSADQPLSPYDRDTIIMVPDDEYVGPDRKAPAPMQRTCARCGKGYSDVDQPMSVYPACQACSPALG